MNRKLVAAMLLSGFCLALAAQAATTLRVVVVEASDLDGYVKAMEEGKALMKAKGSAASIRVWRARFAGTETGTVVVSVEYPSMEAFAKDDAMMASDPDVRAWLKSLDKYRKVVSDSMYSELSK